MKVQGLDASFDVWFQPRAEEDVFRHNTSITICKKHQTSSLRCVFAVTRLNNASSLLEGKGKYFEEFMDHEIPEYAIVSRRWGRDEVTFKNMETIVKYP